MFVKMAASLIWGLPFFIGWEHFVKTASFTSKIPDQFIGLGL
ncbi:hypothetical protein AcetOrient_orf02238 [Acetobacter orientalis]|uniref:Uncharacterized protein n=1 Tax=Acetobacter orientalis TaxID=146474 RepID=A0A2Z5ZGK8_9PROT|nr:hypothetical protein AcetOrient_orf02238 [Acetobacter orientalis]